MCLPLAANDSCKACGNMLGAGSPQQRSDPRTAFSATNSAGGSCRLHASPQPTCATFPAKSADTLQRNAIFHALNKMTKTKSYLCLLIIFCAVLVRTAHAKPAVVSGRRLILHTTEHRQRYHQQLLQQRRTEAPPTPYHRHHLHHRSADNMPLSSNSCTFKEALIQANNSINTVHHMLREYVIEHLNHSLESMNEKLLLIRLNMEYPFREELKKAVLNFELNPAVEEVAEGTINHKQVLLKAYVTLEILDNAFGKAIEYLNAHRSHIVHDIGKQRFTKSNELLLQLRQFVNYDLGEVRILLNELNIEPPLRDSEQTVNIENHHGLEWLLAKEYMIIMQYLRGVYQRLQNGC